ncbi:cysteine desulfurase [Tenacibaculum sp. Bg11-29]|uniref:cysteine desulfurase family protein n=1 Tax=Tenacibaculum sp. Bg11-29 TaxID=2058306 RepID=UPI000C327AF5|nr:cysteine desulfurase family protein [Tenacibaculum sp. Bg11-29]PKH51039.1 cysteine desulfurase [Tenacibaculum sp. Bg11-29]
MKAVYLDNAATTPMLLEVVEVMQQSMLSNFGNPSSVHQFGRKARAAIETARKKIAKHFNVSAREIFFTAGGTEADNLILYNAVLNLGVKRIVTSRIEHYAVLRTVEYLQKTYNIDVDYVNVNEQGVIQLDDLEVVLKSTSEKTLVSLMYVNNEIGNLLPIQNVAVLCKKHDAYFHSDTVQVIGRYQLDLQKTPIDFIVASGHKFHGPKGIGFAYVRKGISIRPILHGGGQENGVRSSTENVHAILGMEKALEISYKKLDEDREHIVAIKSYFIQQLKTNFKDVQFNGESDNLEKSSYTILNVRFQLKDKMLLFNLDLVGIAVSGGSACQSGASKGSHVLMSFLKEEDVTKTSIRFSFSKLTTLKEVDFTVSKLKEFILR